MWFVGYLLFVLAYALSLHWALYRQRRYQPRLAAAAIAALALPIAWSGQVFLIPLNLGGRITGDILLPHLAIAGFSVGVGLVNAWWLGRARAASRKDSPSRAKYAIVFTFFHAFGVLLAMCLLFGLWPGS